MKFEVHQTTIRTFYIFGRDCMQNVHNTFKVDSYDEAKALVKELMEYSDFDNCKVNITIIEL